MFSLVTFDMERYGRICGGIGGLYICIFSKSENMYFFFKVKIRYGLDMPIGNFSFNNRLGIGRFYFFSKKLFFEKKYLVCVGFLVVFCVFSLPLLPVYPAGFFCCCIFFRSNFQISAFPQKRLPSIFLRK